MTTIYFGNEPVMNKVDILVKHVIEIYCYDKIKYAKFILCSVMYFLCRNSNGVDIHFNLTSYPLKTTTIAINVKLLHSNI